MKYLVCLIAALMLAGNVEAKQKNNKNNQQAQKAKAEKEKERKEREARREAITEFLKGKDANHDGSLTRDEYLTGEADAAAASKKFDQYNKNGDRALSKSEIAAMLGV